MSPKSFVHLLSTSWQDRQSWDCCLGLLTDDPASQGMLSPTGSLLVLRGLLVISSLQHWYQAGLRGAPQGH